MVKVVSEELELPKSRKAKRMLSRVKAAALATAIIVSSFHGTQRVEASSTDIVGEDYLSFDHDGMTVVDAEVKEEQEQKDQTSIQVDAQGDQFVAFDMDGNLIENAQAPEAYRGEEVQASREPVEVANNEVAKKGVNYNVEIDSEYSDKCLPTLEDVPMDAVDEHYIGIAPIGYIGPQHEMKNFGDASNPDEVKDRAQKILNAINESNEVYTELYGGPAIINNITGQPWTLEEISDVIRFVNGAQPAKTDNEAQFYLDELLELICNPFDSEPFRVEDINYKAGNSGENGPITEEDVTEHDNILERVRLFDFLMGDSANGPFLQWMSDKIYAFSKETDPEKAAKIYDEAFLAIVALVEGNGFVINGVNYKIDNFHKVNDLVLLIEVLIAEASGNLNYNEIGYIFNKQYVGEVIVFLNDVLEQFNAICAEELVEKLLENGVEHQVGVIVDGSGNALNIRNYGSVQEMNALGQARQVGEYGDEIYQLEYNQYYDGPYDGSEVLYEDNGSFTLK